MVRPENSGIGWSGLFPSGLLVKESDHINKYGKKQKAGAH